MATAIRTEGLTKRYGDVVALDHLDLEVGTGEVVGYLGPNGAGKTTTIRLLLGLSRPTEGRAEVFGLDCQRQPVDVHRRLAFVPGEANLWPALTGGETLALLGRVHGQVDEAYRDELVHRFDLDPTKKVRAYSKGNRQKVVLVAALMVRPDLLVLDEPTSGLDPLMEQAFRHCIGEARERGQTVFLSSHILSEVEALCDRVGILREGSLVEIGTLADMRHLERAERRGDLRRHHPRPLRRAGGELGADERPRGPLPGPWPHSAPPAGPGRRRRHRAREPGALARGAVPGPVRRGRPCTLSSRWPPPFRQCGRSAAPAPSSRA